MRVLQVEDDAIVARGTELLLRSVGSIVDTAGTGAEALEILRMTEYDIMIVDLQLPDMQGHELVRQMRARRIETPVLMVTGFSAPAAKMAAFAVGVDDFVAKPVDNAELIARLRAIVRRNNGFSHRVLQAGPVRLDQDGRTLAIGGSPVRLTRKEFDLLELLLIRRGRVVTKGTVLDHLYGGLDEPTSRTVDVFLCYLRKKMAGAGAPDLIQTVAGVGYRIDAEMAADAMVEQPVATVGHEARAAAAL